MSFDPARLYTTLLNTGLQQKDNALYQVIHSLIGVVAGLNAQTTTIISSGNTGHIGPQGIAGVPGVLLESEGSEEIGFRPNPSIQDLISNFTKGSIIFSGVSGFLSQNNANFFWDNTALQLGIGTASPTDEILVLKTVAGPIGIRVKNLSTAGGNTHASLFVENSSSYGQLFKAGTGYVGYKNIAANDLGFYNTAGNISVLSESGNISFGWDSGVSTPQFKIDPSTGVTASTNTPITGPVIIATTRLSAGSDTTSFLRDTTIEATGLAVRDSGNTTYRAFRASNLGISDGGAIYSQNRGRLSVVGDGNWSFVNQAGTLSSTIGFDNLSLANGQTKLIHNGSGILLISNTAQTIGFTLNGAVADTLSLKNIANSALATFISGNHGIGQTPTAALHIKAGTATASTAPLKFTAGVNLTALEIGAMEFADNGTTGHLYITLNVAGVLTRVQIV